MKTFLPFCLSFLLIALSLQAQSNFAPLGSHWNYGYYQHNGNYQSSATIKVTQDSVSGNEQIKTLSLLENRYNALPPFQNGPYASLYGYLHHRNDSVFFHPYLQSPLQYIYNFNMNIGDSVHIVDAIGLYAVVVLHDSITVSGQIKQRWTLTKHCDQTLMDSIVIIEDIGPINDLLTWNSEGCVIGGGEWTFQCYSSDSLSYNTPCVPVMVGTEEAVDRMPAWTIAPNPALDRFTVSWNAISEPVQLTVYDMVMRPLQASAVKGSGSMELDLGGQAEGVYWVRIQTNGSSDVKRLVKLK